MPSGLVYLRRFLEALKASNSRYELRGAEIMVSEIPDSGEVAAAYSTFVSSRFWSGGYNGKPTRNVVLISLGSISQQRSYIKAVEDTLRCSRHLTTFHSHWTKAHNALELVSSPRTRVKQAFPL